MLVMIRSLIIRDFKLMARNQAEILYPLLFFIMLLAIFPLSISKNPQLLQTVAPGLINVLFVLSIMLNADRLFQEDFRDGSLALFFMSTLPFTLMVATRILLSWFISCGLLLLLTPLMSLLFYLPLHVIYIQAGVLLLTSPVLCLMAAFANALTLGLRQSALLLLLLVLPLYLPLIILGSGTVNLALENFPVKGQLALLAAFLIVAMMVFPKLIASILRLRLEN